MAMVSTSLEEFGLSKYEAQAYVALVSKGTISASDLAYYSEIPRTKVYPTLLKLEKKNLVIISKSKPIMCTAASPEDAFEGIIHEQVNRVNVMNSIVSELKKAGEEGRKGSGSEEKRYLHISAGSVLEQLQKMIEGSKSSIKAMAGQQGLVLLSGCKEQLVGAKRRDLDVRIIVHPQQVCSDAYRKVPEGIEIRSSEITQNCFIFDGTEVLMVDGRGRGAMFSSTGILGANQEDAFAGIWKDAARTDVLADMTNAEAQEICKIVGLVGRSGLQHVMNSHALKKDPGIFKLLEKNGVLLGKRPLDEMIEIIDAVLQITCMGNASFEPGAKSITIESGLNSGHSLPWASVMEGFLQKKGYKTRTVYHGNQARGERVHIKIGNAQGSGLGAA